MAIEACPSCGGSGSHLTSEWVRTPPGVCGPTMTAVEVRSWCSRCGGSGTVEVADRSPEMPFFGRNEPRTPKKSIFYSMAEGAAWFVEHLPPLRGLSNFGKAIIQLPGKYMVRLAGIGALVGCIYGICYRPDPWLILVATVWGAIGGGMLLPAVGIFLCIVAYIVGYAILLGLIGGGIAALFYLLSKAGS